MDERSMPGGYVLYSIELVKRYGITASDLLEGTGVVPDALGDPRVRIPIPIIVQILERARSLTKEPALGFFLGIQMGVSAHGYVGAAALAASTMRDAIDLAVRFGPILTTALTLRLRVEGREASLILDEHADFGPARDSVILAALNGIRHIGQTMTTHSLTGYMDLALPTPSYCARLHAVAPGVRFQQPVHRLLFDASALELRYALADPVALKLALDRCERTLASLGNANRVTTRVRSLFGADKRGLPTIDAVAKTLHVSARTLKRQLAAEGTSFSQLVDEERRERAMFLIAAPDVSLKDIADRLGYANLANFTRAFQRWTGHTPGQHRGLQRAGAVSR
jgi:AraC-like DNA-binding protein